MEFFEVPSIWNVNWRSHAIKRHAVRGTTRAHEFTSNKGMESWPAFAKPPAETGITTALGASALRVLVEACCTWKKATEMIQSGGMT